MAEDSMPNGNPSLSGSHYGPQETASPADRAADGCADPSVAAQKALIEVLAGDDLRLREAIETKLIAMRHALAGPDASAIEQLMADNVVSCWLKLQVADALLARSGNRPDQERTGVLRHQEAAQRRYAESLQQLDRHQRRFAAIQAQKARAPGGRIARAADDDPLSRMARSIRRKPDGTLFVVPEADDDAHLPYGNSLRA